MDINEGILVEYLKGNLDEEARNSIEKWYDESPDNRKQMEQIYYTLFVGDRAAVMENIDVDESLNNFKARLAEKNNKNQTKEKKIKQINWRRIIAMAAIFAGILFGATFTGMKIAGKLSQSFMVMTKSGERAQVALPDGTNVWLNTNSKVNYHTSFFSSERKVDLSGEAYFEVTKDKHSPFIVNSKNVNTKVLGTKFNICANPDDEWVTTTLLEGSILVMATGMENVKMKPEQQLKINTRTMKTQLSVCSNPDDYIGWIQGKLHFKEATLKEIANTLVKYYKVNIIFADKKLQEQKFTGDFDLSDSIHQIFSLLSLTNKFDYQITNEGIIISER